MADIVKALYNCAFTVWNALMKIAMTLFTTSPKLAGGGTPYSTVHTFYNAIADATVPIATVFFIIAIYKSVVSAPPGQQAQRFLHDALRYCIILYIAANMWSIMGYIIDFTDGITGKISATSGYTLSVSGDMENIINTCLKLPSFELSGEWLEKFWSTIGCSLLFLIGGIVLLFIMVASCLSIISSAFQRILKPLMILPFAGIAIALGAGGHDISRSLLTYIKTFFGFCISGALMVVAVKTGVSLCTNLVNFDLTSASNVYKCILITVQMAITPIVISGLVKGSDAITARMF
ncbi:MAG TPA: type IV secretion system protein [Lachnospiraceae bacterium]|nr:type IV secretion system protein [Lachnospiraceae bacterium]